MRKGVLFGCVFVVFVVVLASSVVSVVGSGVSGGSGGSVVSPLFSVRVHRFVDGRYSGEGVKCDYVGKGKTLNLFLSKKTFLHIWLDRAIKIIERNPHIINMILDKIQKTPRIVNTLREYNIDIEDFNAYINQIKNDPSTLKQKIEEAVQKLGSQPNLHYLSDDPPFEPLGNFSGQIGCILVFFLVIFPLLIMIGTMIATFTIITCLNVGGCFERILQAIFEGFSQGLTPPHL